MSLGLPEPLWGVNPRSIKGKKWWDEMRKKAYAENNYTCWACGVHRLDAAYKQHLEAHEVYEIDFEAGKMTFIEIVALCPACHSFVHSGRMRNLVVKGRVTRKKFREVKEHGTAALGEDLWMEYGRMRAAIPVTLTAWAKWHLVFEGESYCKDPTGKIVTWRKPQAFTYLRDILKGQS